MALVMSYLCCQDHAPGLAAAGAPFVGPLGATGLRGGKHLATQLPLRRRGGRKVGGPKVRGDAGDGGVGGVGGWVKAGWGWSDDRQLGDESRSHVAVFSDFCWYELSTDPGAPNQKNLHLSPWYCCSEKIWRKSDQSRHLVI